MSKRGQCTVCGYIHIGGEPPASCPVCGADRSKFIPVESEKSGLLRAAFATFKLHPSAAHFPGGLTPTAALFLFVLLSRVARKAWDAKLIYYAAFHPNDYRTFSMECCCTDDDRIACRQSI